MSLHAQQSPPRHRPKSEPDEKPRPDHDLPKPDDAPRPDQDLPGAGDDDPERPERPTPKRVAVH